MLYHWMWGTAIDAQKIIMTNCKLLWRWRLGRVVRKWYLERYGGTRCCPDVIAIEKPTQSWEEEAADGTTKHSDKRYVLYSVLVQL